MTVVNQPILELKGLTKKYNDFTAVESVDLSIQAGEFITLLGPSGSGKTTILQMIAGFTKPTDGEVYLNGQEISNTPPNKRNMGVVFQDYALFPHMTVYDNIAYSLKIRKQDKQTISKLVNETINLVQLDAFKHRKPNELSGGQQQRVALARALVFKPSLLLMDEPLGALDKKLREHVQLEIKRIQELLGVTIIFVTHDQEEALVMSDRIAVLNESKLVQFGTPRELYEHPNSYFIADFIGKNNFIPCLVTNISEQRISVKVDDNHVIYTEYKTNKDLAANDEVFISVRPENIHLFSAKESNGGIHADYNRLMGEVSDVIFLGEGIKYLITIPGLVEKENVLTVITKKDTSFTRNDQVIITFHPRDTFIFRRTK